MTPDLLLKMAQLQTVVDAVELLTYLKQETSSCHWQRIDDMVQRLTNMGASLAP